MTRKINCCVYYTLVFPRLAKYCPPGKIQVGPGFPGLGNTPRNGSTGQYWVMRYFPPVFIMIYFACIVVLLLKLNIL